eukprot:6185807-Pleurochrysis_carterae.AAC.4
MARDHTYIKAELAHLNARQDPKPLTHQSVTQSRLQCGTRAIYDNSLEAIYESEQEEHVCMWVKIESLMKRPKATHTSVMFRAREASGYDAG